MVLISGPLKTVGPGFTKMASGMIHLFLQSQRVEANKDGKVIYILYIYIYKVTVLPLHHHATHIAFTCKTFFNFNNLFFVQINTFFCSLHLTLNILFNCIYLLPFLDSLKIIEMEP